MASFTMSSTLSKAILYFSASDVAVADFPDSGAPCTISAIPRLFLAALPSGDRSIPRCRAMAADIGVISNSPTPKSDSRSNSIHLSIFADDTLTDENYNQCRECKTK